MFRYLFHILVLILIWNNSFARNKAVADSCRNLMQQSINITDEEKCNLLYQIIINNTNPDTCILYADKLINIAERIENPLFLHHGFYEKGQAYMFKSLFKESVFFLQESLRIAEKYDFRTEIGLVYYALSQLYHQNNNHRLTIEYLQKSNVLFNENPENSTYIGSSLYHLGNVYFKLEKLDSALINFNKALVLFNKIQSPFSFYIRGNIGAIQTLQNKPDSARINLLSAISALEKFGDNGALVNYYLFLSKNELINCKLPLKALGYVNKAMDFSSGFSNPELQRDIYEQLAKVYEATGQFEKAYQYQNEYYTLRDSLVNIDVVTEMANLRTEFEVGQKQAEVDKLETLNRSKSRTVLIIVFGLVVVTVLLVFVYFGYHQKLMLNRKLQKQQKILAASQAEMEEANSAKDRLFSVISHDLRGPVSSIRSLAKLIEQSINACRFKDAEELSVSMADTTQQVEFLLDNLLHWSISRQNLYKPRKEAFELNKLVSEVVNVYSQTAQAKNILLAYNPGYSRLTIQSDSNCWATIIRNLVNNALKFTHVGGKVEISSLYNNGFVHLSVSDNGIGMTQEQIGNLFNQIGTVSEWGTQNEKGQGLGLCLVNDFVTMQDGTIEVHSELGKGSCFTVIIPAILISKEEHVVLNPETTITRRVKYSSPPKNLGASKVEESNPEGVEYLLPSKD